MLKGQNCQKNEFYKRDIFNYFKNYRKNVIKLKNKIYVVLVSESPIKKKQIYDKCIISGDISVGKSSRDTLHTL